MEDRPPEEEQKEMNQWGALGCFFVFVLLVLVLGIGLGIVPLIIVGPLLAPLFWIWFRERLKERAARKNYQRRMARETSEHEEPRGEDEQH